MPFLAYVAIVLVSIGGILFELDWLTKPKLETTPAAQVASTVAPVRVVPKVDGPTEGPTPLNTKKQEAEPVIEGPAAVAKADVPPVNQSAGTAPAMTPAPFPPGAAEAKAAPQPRPQLAAQPPAQAPVPATLQPAAATGQAPAQATVAAVVSRPQVQPQVQPPAQPMQAAARLAPNSCDVAGCASAYQSFRASDCSYQPMEGPRKFCAPAANQRTVSTPREPRIEQTVRRPSRDAELRDVERTVRSITTGDDAGYDSRNEPRMGRSEVIVIERPGRDW
jgi:hypothetical protein